MKYNLFIGRWQPFHEGHKYIIDSFVNNGKKVCIGIRDTDIDMKNPIDIDTRFKIISKIYQNNENVKVIVLPDIENVCVGRDVGYSIMEVPEKISKISGTKARMSTEFKMPLKEMNRIGHVFWLTGLPCSGKTTLAKAMIDKFSNILFQHLDGDVLRNGMCKDLGFSEADRFVNLRRVRDLCKILTAKGINVICSFVSPYRAVRQKLRKTLDNFHEIYIKTSKETCLQRDVKGMWAKAKAGKIKGFTGWDAPYEEPENPELTIDTDNINISCCRNIIEDYIKGIVNDGSFG